MSVICSVCLDELIAPVSMRCGHSTCFECAVRLENNENMKKTCPECRASGVNGERNINIVLDQLLHNIIPNYAEKKRIMLKSETDKKLMMKYQISTRYSRYSGSISEYIYNYGYASWDNIMGECLKHEMETEPSVDEILYILYHDSFVPIKIGDIEYFVDTQNNTNIYRFAEAISDNITPEIIYSLLIHQDPGYREIFRLISPAISNIQKLQYNKDKFVEHISKLNLESLSNEIVSDEDEDEDEDNSNRSSNAIDID